jgi:hypothetical protein
MHHVARAAADVKHAASAPWSDMAVKVSQDRPRARGEPPMLIFFDDDQHRG